MVKNLKIYTLFFLFISLFISAQNNEKEFKKSVFQMMKNYLKGDEARKDFKKKDFYQKIISYMGEDFELYFLFKDEKNINYYLITEPFKDQKPITEKTMIVSDNGEVIVYIDTEKGVYSQEEIFVNFKKIGFLKNEIKNFTIIYYDDFLELYLLDINNSLISGKNFLDKNNVYISFFDHNIVCRYNKNLYKFIHFIVFDAPPGRDIKDDEDMEKYFKEEEEKLYQKWQEDLKKYRINKAQNKTVKPAILTEYEKLKKEFEFQEILDEWKKIIKFIFFKEKKMNPLIVDKKTDWTEVMREKYNQDYQIKKIIYEWNFFMKNLFIILSFQSPSVYWYIIN